MCSPDQDGSMTDARFMSSSNIHSADYRSSSALQSGKRFGCGPCSLTVEFFFGADVENWGFEDDTIADIVESRDTADSIG